ncbi:MAG TPA: hypothetical protein VJX72_10740, partial [Candidatus Acidoferrum sp.]|nr:hypothetical protein [Candidatus Acidoferrum sp.]
MKRNVFSIFCLLLLASVCWGQVPSETAPPIITQAAYFPVWGLNPVGVSGASIQLTGTPGQATWYFWASANF